MQINKKPKQTTTTTSKNATSYRESATCLINAKQKFRINKEGKEEVCLFDSNVYQDKMKPT